MKNSLKSAAVFLIIVFSSSVFAASNYRNAALETAKWLKNNAVKTDKGTIWYSDPKDTKSIDLTLYAGVPGVVLFFLEANRSTGKKEFLQNATDGADYLLAELSNQKESGFYEGIAGIGFVLNETYKATKNQKYKDGAIKSVRLLQERAIKTGNGVEWNGVNDIISGTAGIGLYLLYAARELEDDSALQTAVLAGKRLLEIGEKQEIGINWRMDLKMPLSLPNFSHGTAGVSYFFASLYKETKDELFLNAAISGANYLLSIAKQDSEQCLIYHSQPKNKELYYLGWCHGPAGTSRLFYRLYEVTKNADWLKIIDKQANSLLKSGIPEKQTPGFWNNAGVCCGSSGVTEFFIDLYGRTKDKKYLGSATKMTENLLSRSIYDKDGRRWIQAEHRVKPDLLVAQTGFSQGAAGIGIMLLRMDYLQKNKSNWIKLPDSPY